jgi:diaminobutyrate-2-oxoglutarate transaminase
MTHCLIHALDNMEAENQRPASLSTIESEVRSYCRVFPAEFCRGEGVFLYDTQGRRWYDFLSAAGSLNYGHNPPQLKSALLNYIEANGVTNSLDLHTQAKRTFLETFDEVILRPRGLDYKVQFCGPTGANAVEAALKLARKVTGRHGVVAFSNSYHGMSMGAMSVSASHRRRNESYLSPNWVDFLPFDGFTGLPNELDFLRKLLQTKGSGVAPPAAFIVEPVQGEGGVNIASSAWLAGLRELADELGALLIFDEIQCGCGRSGSFFAFEHSGIQPDIVCLSKSISGMGLPMSILLLAPKLDVWTPGEHNGTFRGFNYAFVTATAALREYWASPDFRTELEARSAEVQATLSSWSHDFHRHVVRVSVLGMFAGIRLASTATAQAVQQTCYEDGLIIERCGPESDTLKLLPPVVISHDELDAGLCILRAALVRHCE